MTKVSFYLLMGIIAIIGCGDGDLTFLSQPESSEIRTTCFEDQYTSQSRIEELLLGEWQLISYGCGFCLPHDPPSASIVFSAADGVLTITEDPDIGQSGEQVIPFTWKVETKTSILNDSLPTLITDPPHYAVNGMNVFCEEFMYYDITPVDGHMVLYQKR